MGATAAPMKTPTAFGDLFDEEFVPGQDSAEGVFDTEKEASAAVDIPHANPHGDLVRLRDHLVAARDNVLSKLAMAEVSYEDIGSRLYQEAKQLVLSGRSPAEVAGALIAAGDGSPMTKEALSLISDRMEREAIPAVETTISKLAANRLVNMRHPLVQTFADFVKIAEARYSLVDQKSIIDEQLGRVNGALMEVMK